MQTIEYVVADHTARLTLNRPEKMNAINVQMRRELWEALNDIKDNREVWLAVLTGRGKAFCAGHDLTEPARYGDAPVSEELFALQSRIPKPIIAAINGLCLAQGGGLVLASDIRIASTDARFGWPQARRGITSVSGPVMLTRQVPWHRAMELLFTGSTISAEDALGLGLLSYVVPPAELEKRTEEIVTQIRNNAPLAVRGMKEIALQSAEMPLEQALKFAFLMFERLEQTEDAKEGLRAFQEKRPPVWHGR